MLASGAIGQEFYFRKPKVFQVVNLCTNYNIAILGIEILERRSEGFHAKGFSEYEVTQNDWEGFVKENNTLAEEFLSNHNSSAADVYVLTTSSQHQMNKLRKPGETF